MRGNCLLISLLLSSECFVLIAGGFAIKGTGSTTMTGLAPATTALTAPGISWSCDVCPSVTSWDIR